MSKSNKTTNEAVNTLNETSTVLSYEEILAKVPAKEHRTFTAEDYAAVQCLVFPDTVAEIAAFVKGLSPNKVFALLTICGKTKCQRIAKLFLADGVVLKASAAASFKSVDKGGSEFIPGKTAYGLLSYVKNS